MKIKKDRYLNERGGTAKIIDVSCMKCGKRLLVYQKDGPGWLKRCYLNRIIEPKEFVALSKNKRLTEKDLDVLACQCGQVIGTPITHKDGRLAFHLIKSKFSRKNNK